MDLTFLSVNGGTTSPSLPLSRVLVHEMTTDVNHQVSVAEAVGIGYGIDNSGAKSNYTINGISYSTSLNIYNWIMARVTFVGMSSSQAQALAYAASVWIRIMVCSDTGFSGAVTKYDKVQLFMPLGTNTYTQLTFSPDTECNVITAGSSVADANNNGTAYGNTLSFFDTYDGTSSRSNGIIAGKMLYIKEQRSVLAGYETSWWNARYSAMQTASGSGSRTLTNGWGKISTSAAIAYSGSVPPDPYNQT